MTDIADLEKQKQDLIVEIRKLAETDEFAKAWANKLNESSKTLFITEFYIHLYIHNKLKGTPNLTEEDIKDLIIKVGDETVKNIEFITTEYSPNALTKYVKEVFNDFKELLQDKNKSAISQKVIDDLRKSAIKAQDEILAKREKLIAETPSEIPLEEQAKPEAGLEELKEEPPEEPSAEASSPPIIPSETPPFTSPPPIIQPESPIGASSTGMFDTGSSHSVSFSPPIIQPEKLKHSKSKSSIKTSTSTSTAQSTATALPRRSLDISESHPLSETQSYLGESSEDESQTPQQLTEPLVSLGMEPTNLKQPSKTTVSKGKKTAKPTTFLSPKAKEMISSPSTLTGKEAVDLAQQLKTEKQFKQFGKPLSKKKQQQEEKEEEEIAKEAEKEFSASPQLPKLKPNPISETGSQKSSSSLATNISSATVQPERHFSFESQRPSLSQLQPPPVPPRTKGLSSLIKRLKKSSF